MGRIGNERGAFVCYALRVLKERLLCYCKSTELYRNSRYSCVSNLAVIAKYLAIPQWCLEAYSCACLMVERNSIGLG